MPKLNHYTYGMKLGALDVFTSGTGCGKTQIFRELIFHLLKSTDANIGIISLEESVKDTIDGLAGLYLEKRIHLQMSEKLYLHQS
jgi:twinkle protein